MVPDTLIVDNTIINRGEYEYKTIVMDLHSRRIVGWAISKRMTVSLVERALQMALTLRKPARGVMFHSDRGS